MEVFFRKTVSNISFLMLNILDGIMELFNAFAGITTVNVGEESAEGTDILTFFLSDSRINKAFLGILVISGVLLCFFTAIAVFKTMASAKKSHEKVVTHFFAAFLAFFISQIVIFAGIGVSNQVLKLVHNEMGASNTVTLSQRIFDICVPTNGWFYDKERGVMNSKTDFSPSMTASKVFGSYKESKISGMEKSPDTDLYFDENAGDGGDWIPYTDNKLHNGKGIADLFKIDLLLLFVIPLIMLLLIGLCVLKLAKRLFNVILLYLSMPLIVSSLPLDEGARFKIWRENTISNILNVYGAVIAMNLYIIFLGIIGGGITISGKPFINTLFFVFLMLGGAFAASAGADLFASLLGGQQHQGGNLGQAIYSGMQAAHLGGAVLGGAKKLLTGGGKKGAPGGAGGGNGGSGGGGGGIGGLIGGIGKIGNAAATAIGGQRYTGMKQNMRENYANLKSVVKGNGIIQKSVPGENGKPQLQDTHAGKFTRKAQEFMEAGGIAGTAKGLSDFKKSNALKMTGESGGLGIMGQKKPKQGE